MKKVYIHLTLILISLLLISSCKKEVTLSFENIIKNNDWTQKVGYDNNTHYGLQKMFFKLSFQDNGKCTIVYFINHEDTVQVNYLIEDNKILFPEPYSEGFGTFGGDTILIKSYFSDWEKISILDDIIHLKSIENPEKYGVIFSPLEIYIEPIN